MAALTLLVFPTSSLMARSTTYHMSSSKKSSQDFYHFGYIGGGVGYSMLSTNVKDMHAAGALGGNIGGGYEFRYSGLWSSVGIQFSLHNSSANLDNYRESYRGIATNGNPATFYYDVEQKDQNQWLNVGIPVMIGYYKYGFYVGAGAKIAYYLSPKVRSTGKYELSAKHDQYQVVFRNLPQYGYTTYEYNTKHMVKLRPELSVIGEIGYDLLSSMPTRSSLCHVLKIGFYFEYGLNKIITPSTAEHAIVVNPNNATQADVLPFLATSISKDSRVVPFYTGVKLTYVIGGSRTAHKGSFHHGCLCYE